MATLANYMRINDSVYELYKPPGIPSVQVIFFHGFQIGSYEDAHISAWVSADGTCLWPQTWLVDDFPTAHILSVSYSYLLRWEVTDVYVVIENLMSDLVDANIGQMPHCPVILVGHSFGGMVIKSVLVNANRYANKLPENPHIQKVNNFLRNVKGLFFYSAVDGFSRQFNERLSKGALLVLVNALDRDMDRINHDFNSLLEGYNWPISALGESLPTRLGQSSSSSSSLVVPEASSRGLDGYAAVTADHISISKPRNKSAISFSALSLFIKKQTSRGLDTISGEQFQLQRSDSRSGDGSSGKRPENYQHLPPSIIGLDLTLEEVKFKLQKPHTMGIRVRKSTKLGIVGMGGIGKTTLAKMLFNDLQTSLQRDFEYTCFVNDVKNVKDSDQKEVLLEYILECMHQRGKKVLMERRADLDFLKGKLLFLVLDDVALENHLEIISILDSDICVHRDSLFIVTSRDSQLLSSYIDAEYIVPFLDTENARLLLLSYTFPDHAVVPPSFDRYVDDILQRCDGLPLTIEIVGKYLYKKRNEEIWEQVIIALDNATDVLGFKEKLWARLKLSYDGLDNMEQKMFLDAATVFYNADLDVAKAAWRITTKGCQDITWRRLVESSFVFESRASTDNSDNFSYRPIKVGMHEQLLSLGRKIALDSHEGHGRRIWDNRQAMEMLSAKSHDARDVVEDIVALNLDMEKQIDEKDSFEGMTYAPEEPMISTLSKMRRLQHLFLGGIHLDQIYSTALPSTLVSLTLSKADFTDLPLEPSNHNSLAVLSLNSCHQLRTLPDAFDQLSSLQVLHISRCYGLKSLPDEFGHLPKLKHLEIEACNILRKLPPSLGDLAALEHLILRDCKALAVLPDSLQRLQHLKTLVIDSCNLIKTLTRRQAQLPRALKRLSLSYCRALSSLPESLGELRSLKALVVQSCPALDTLPDSFGGLQSLEALSLSDCGKLSSLPAWSFEQLQSLKTLVVQKCPDLRTLPEEFGLLESLEDLSLSGCGISYLPDSLGALKRLQKLVIQSFPVLRVLPDTIGDLGSLEDLSVSDCKCLSYLPESLGSLPKLKKLVIQSCPALDRLPEGLGRLQTLEDLSVNDCKSLIYLPESLGELRSLKTLVVQSCPVLRMLPDAISHLELLEVLILTDCTSLSSWPQSLGNLRRLKKLEVHGCPGLRDRLPLELRHLQTLKL